MRNRVEYNILKAAISIAIIISMVGIAAANGNGNGNGGPGFKQLRMYSDSGTIIGEDNLDPWLTDSILVTGSSPFTVEVLYKYDGSGNHPACADGSFLVLTTNLNPAFSGIQVALSNFRYDPGNPTGIGDVTIGVGDWTQFQTNGLTYLEYFHASHGVLNPPNWYTIVRLDDVNDGGQCLEGNDQNALDVDVSVSSLNSGTRLHFDSIGTCADSSLPCGAPEGREIGFVGNPYSKDITWQIPEFPTVALPVAAVIGLVFFFQRRRQEK